jgi:hypothetical protein
MVRSVLHRSRRLRPKVSRAISGRVRHPSSF